MQSDRTRELLELDLADRGRAITQLEGEFDRQPAAWQAYSLGVLYGADEDFAAMNLWFAECRRRTDQYDPKIERIRLEHWRDWARRADGDFEAGRWPEAFEACETALLAAPEKQETRFRLIEARVMAWGPELEEIRALVAADRTAVLDRWLEAVAATPASIDEVEASEASSELAASRMDVRVRLASQLRNATRQPADSEAVFVLGELCRLDRDWVGMNYWYEQAGGMLAAPGADTRRAAIMSSNRRLSADQLLGEALLAWSDDRAGLAVARIDTAAMVDLNRGDLVLARRNLEMLLSAEGSTEIRTILAMGDVNPGWLALWMTQLYNHERYREAAQVADALLADSPDQDGALPSQATADPEARKRRDQALRIRGAWGIRSGDLEGAARDLKDLLEGGLVDPVTAVTLGDVSMSLSRYEAARRWYGQAAAWSGSTTDLLLRQSRVAFCQGRFPDMLVLMNQALALDGADARVQHLHAEARRLNGLDELEPARQSEPGEARP